MWLEAAAEAAETPEAADGRYLYLGSRAGRLEQQLGSEDHTVLPTGFE